MFRFLRAALTRTVWGHPCYVWLLWVLVIAVMSKCPGALSDPGMWPLLLDPELVVLLIICAAYSARLQLFVIRMWLRSTLLAVYRRWSGTGSS
jgi:hypothetical protein